LTTPRQRRFAPVGYDYHIGSRGNERRRIFFEDADYEWFLRLLVQGRRRYAVKIYGVCPMPNHVHAVIRPESEGALSAYVQWVLSGYSRHVRQSTDTVGAGHVFKKPFWSDGIDDSQHFLTVLRYIEANPVQAKLVSKAEDWPWSSLVLRKTAGILDPLPLTLPETWSELVAQPLSWEELNSVRYVDPPRRKAPTEKQAVNRGPTKLEG
jgi:REP-associated tyrosine transposase